jgi:hypothetical protein
VVCSPTKQLNQAVAVGELCLRLPRNSTSIEGVIAIQITFSFLFLISFFKLQY